jgi:hypothetical protein
MTLPSIVSIDAQGTGAEGGQLNFARADTSDCCIDVEGLTTNRSFRFVDSELAAVQMSINMSSGNVTVAGALSAASVSGTGSISGASLTATNNSSNKLVAAVGAGDYMTLTSSNLDGTVAKNLCVPSGTCLIVGATSTSTTYALDVTGDGHFSGNVVSGSTTLTSDERIKQHIAPIDGADAIACIDALTPVSYEMRDVARSSNKTIKNSNGNKVYGFIAQDVARVLPEAVLTGANYLPNVCQWRTPQRVGGNCTRVYIDARPYDGLVAGNRLKVQHECDSIVVLIKSYDADSGELDIIETFPSEWRQIYIYGAWVDDFHYLQKDVIYAMTVAALQDEVRERRRLAERVAQLEKRLTQLDEREQPRQTVYTNE